MTIDEILEKYNSIAYNTKIGSKEKEYAWFIIRLCDGVEPVPPFPAEYICRMVEKAEKENKRLVLVEGKPSTDRTDQENCKLVLK